MRLYYTPPADNIFEELKESSIKLWSTYDDRFGYATKKISSIKDIENVSDNFMYMVSMFDLENQRKLSEMISEECSKNIKERMIDGGQPLEYIVF